MSEDNQQFEQLISEIRETKAYVLRVYHLLTKRFSNNKLDLVIKMLENSPEGEIRVEDVIKELRISRPYALTLMDEINIRYDDIIKISGHSRCSTRLLLINRKNKEDQLAYKIYKSMQRKGRGNTKKISAIKKETGFEGEELQNFISRIVKISGGHIMMDPSYRSSVYEERRLKYY